MTAPAQSPPEGWLPQDVLDGHLLWMRLNGASEASIYTRRNHLRRLAGRLAVPLLDATEADLLAWRVALRVSPGSVLDCVSHARSFYRWCCAEGLRADNPADRLPVPRKPMRLPRPISEDDLYAALDAAPARIRMMLILAGWCGLRAKEIALLQRGNVLDKATPPVVLVAADATKGRRERVVPLCDFVLAEARAAGLPRAGYLFRRCDDSPGPLQPWRVSQLCNDHLHDCGISESLHQLRHRFGSQAYRVSQDLRVVQELMGHQNPRTTAGYAAYSQAAAIETVAALPLPGGRRPRSGQVRA